MKRLLIIFVVVFIYGSVGFAQEVTDLKENVNLYNTQLKKFHSSIINDNFNIYISLPDNYEESEKRYPVLYLLDGDIAYGLATSIARYLQFGKTIPELIIVGIGYGALNRSKGNMRARDYTISSRKGRSGTGGAPKFQKFIKEELFPYINSIYRTIPDDRTINGYSLGGLFAMYTLFTEPGLFNRYIIGSPHLMWDNLRIFDVQEETFEKLADINAKVFISVGSEEDEENYFNPIDEMVTRITEKGYKNLKLYTKVFDGGTHLLGPPEALSYGLVSVFGKGE
jgi:predicted alpha/beta superfamily hydrolase